MNRELAQAVDRYLTLMEGDRATLDDFLSHHPEFAADLRSLLELADQVRRVPQPVPSSAASADGKRRMLEALTGKKHRQATSPSLFARLRMWLSTPVGADKRAVTRVPILRPAMLGTILFVLFIVAGAILQSWFGVYVTQVATLEEVSGVAEVLLSGSNTWQMAVAGMPLNAGDRVRTAASSAAALAFFDGSRTALEAGTEVAVVQLGSRRDGSGKVILLRQQSGQTYNHVEKLFDPESRFEVETPTAVTAVRGTEFVIGVEIDGTTHVWVAEGQVDVEAEQVTVAIQAGYETVAQPHEPPVAARPITTLVPKVTDEEFSSTPPGLTKTPQPPGQTKTPQPPGLTKTPQPPGQTKTPEPPGLTKTPQPPGQTKTPEPPGLTKTPQPPGLTKTPQPPGQTKTPQPPGLTKTPQPPGQTKTPQAPGLTKTPAPPGQTKTPQPVEKPKPEKPKPEKPKPGKP